MGKCPKQESPTFWLSSNIELRHPILSKEPVSLWLTAKVLRYAQFAEFHSRHQHGSAGALSSLNVSSEWPSHASRASATLDEISEQQSAAQSPLGLLLQSNRLVVPNNKKCSWSEQSCSSTAGALAFVFLKHKLESDVTSLIFF